MLRDLISLEENIRYKRKSTTKINLIKWIMLFIKYKDILLSYFKAEWRARKTRILLRPVKIINAQNVYMLFYGLIGYLLSIHVKIRTFKLKVQTNKIIPAVNLFSKPTCRQNCLLVMIFFKRNVFFFFYKVFYIILIPNHLDLVNG